MGDMQTIEANALTRQTVSAKTVALQAVYSAAWWMLTAGAVVFVLIPVIKSYAARSTMASTIGTVLSASVQKIGSGDVASSYRPDIQYSYSVNNIAYKGTKYSAVLNDASYELAESVVAKYKPTDPSSLPKVKVYYNPAAPSQSLLMIDPPYHFYLLSLLIPPMIAMGLVITLPLIFLPSQKSAVAKCLSSTPGANWRIPGWGTLKQTKGFASITSKGRYVRGLFFGLVIPCLVGCVLSFFILTVYPQLSGRFEEPVFLIATTVSILLSAIAGVIWIGRGRLTVKIDSVLHSVTLAAGKRSVEIPFDQIHSWKIRHIANRRLPWLRMLSREVPLVAIVTKKGREVPIHVFYYRIQPLELARKAAWALANLTGMQFVRLEKPKLEFGELDEGPLTASFPIIEREQDKK